MLSVNEDNEESSEDEYYGSFFAVTTPVDLLKLASLLADALTLYLLTKENPYELKERLDTTLEVVLFSLDSYYSAITFYGIILDSGVVRHLIVRYP